MNHAEVMAALEQAGTAQQRKLFARQGVGPNQYGVGRAKLGTLKKSIGAADLLARSLWATGNHDARVLATMIADPERFDPGTLETWAGELDNLPLTAAFAEFAAATPRAAERARVWIETGGEWAGCAGWTMLAHLAAKENGLTDTECVALLGRIDTGMREASNRVRWAMNEALIAIGARGGSLQKKALVVAKRAGKLQLDYGETGTKPPDAVAQIHKLGDRANTERFWSR